jgi:hypothetical protein
MTFNLLTEKHNLSYGDTITVYERNDNDRKFSYTGTVSHIINKRLNEQDPNSYYVDYIYITFSTNVYNHLLKTGSAIYYKGKPHIVGEVIRNDKTNDIEKLFIQYRGRPEENEIELKDVNSMLIWRVAYEIVKYM